VGYTTNTLRTMFADFLEAFIRWLIVAITNWLPVKIVRDERGRPFLFRYHVFALTNNGPGICIHHFVKSDPDRGYHDHPWSHALSFILCGGYSERIYNKDAEEKYNTFERPRWTFNYLKGEGVFHRVMLDEGSDAWTLFFFLQRSKTWGMIGLDDQYKAMSTQVEDNDGGWWNHVMKGLGVYTRLNNKGNVVATVDTIILAEGKVLLIKRGKNPYKDMWAFPGGRIEQRDSDMLSAARRELREETKLQDVELAYFKTVGNNTRDPRGFCVSNVYVGRLEKIPTNVRAGDDAYDFEWFNVANLPKMAFDHEQIMHDVLANAFDTK
ncbi:NUDIX hydrolase, partial [Yasminevirus sp. GU-2018]